MSASTSYMSGFSSLWTAESKYIIDFERGLVTHSKLLTKGQFNRWMSKGVAAQRPQFNSRQAFQYYSKYLMGEKFLLFLKNAHNNQISKLAFQASPSYIQNHRDLYEKVQNQLVYPIAQMPYGGFVRTKLERDNLVKYVQKIQDKVNNYGMNKFEKIIDGDTSERAYESLREIAFRQRQPAAAIPSESTEQ